jgi:UDP-galactopyranose mutase
VKSLHGAGSRNLTEDQGQHEAFDLLCLSHLRWDWVYQRPQHLMSRCARQRRVWFIEEPVADEGPARLEITERDDGLHIVVPRLTEAQIAEHGIEAQRELIDGLLREQGIERYVVWYYTPMSLSFTQQLTPLATVYDCMDELSAFTGAPPELRQREAELFNRADLVFTGGQSLYESKRAQHPRVHLFPSSVDVAHFAQARQSQPDPPDQHAIPHPRLGFFGVIDERMDLDLLAGVADARPGWQLVIIGPVTKIEPEALPQRANIHYLGGKDYRELPRYLAGWNAALLPFAHNESTRFISPTKTPEYLAAGRPVVSTSIRDVVRPYGDRELVWIADGVPAWVAAIEAALREDGAARQGRVDTFLAQMSWDRTWESMNWLINEAVRHHTTHGGSN